MRDVVQEGVQAVQDSGGDVVLIDSQFSRFLRANTDIDPYEAVLQQIATLPGVVLFKRFDLMRGWANEGRIDLERVSKADREKTVVQLNTCLGELLASLVLDGAAQVTH
jgi:acyl-CoA thioesterase I